MTTSPSPSRWLIVAAFAAVYIIWGSTYLAIRFAIETLPPFLMAGSRFLIAGTLMYAWARWRGAVRPAPIHWRSAAIVGGLLLMGGNGLVTWAEQLIASSIAALLVATVPLWMVLLDWLRPQGVRPTASVVVGLLLGFAGVVLLIGPVELAGGSGINSLGAGLVVVAAFLWATGSLYSRQAPLPSSQWLATGMEMLAGGGLLIVAGLVTGEMNQLNLAGASLRSWLALGYLIVFGSLIAFTAYVWLLQVSEPAQVATYAYVNPIVAVFLGWGLAGETITTQTLLAAAVIVSGVVIITTYRARQNRRTAAAQAKLRRQPAS